LALKPQGSDRSWSGHLYPKINETIAVHGKIKWLVLAEDYHFLEIDTANNDYDSALIGSVGLKKLLSPTIRNDLNARLKSLSL
jgi:hypothetical protein